MKNKKMVFITQLEIGKKGQFTQILIYASLALVVLVVLIGIFSHNMSKQSFQIKKSSQTLPFCKCLIKHLNPVLADSILCISNPEKISLNSKQNSIYMKTLILSCSQYRSVLVTDNNIDCSTYDVSGIILNVPDECLALLK